jgi:hypothetical protein
MSKMLNRIDIENFRSLKDFHVPKLGHVNLIVGRNNSGKSTVLEALRIYAGGATRQLLEEIANEHDEKAYFFDEDIQTPEHFPFANFFTRDGDNYQNAKIVIGDASVEDRILTIERALYKETEELYVSPSTKRRITRAQYVKVLPNELSPEIGALRSGLEIKKGNGSRRLYIDSTPSMLRPSGSIKIENHSFIPARRLLNDELARDWDNILFTEKGDMVVSAIRYVAPDLEALAFVEADSVPSPRIEGRLDLTEREKRRIPVVKLKGISGTMPLNSLGDGAFRVFNLAMKAIDAQDGYLLIDEFENGIHYRAQKNLWKFIFEMSKRFNFQVFATTHSWDCISAFSEASFDDDDVDGMLFRVGKSVKSSDNGRTIATTFDEGQLFGIQQADLEVR